MYLCPACMQHRGNTAVSSVPASILHSQKRRADQQKHAKDMIQPYRVTKAGTSEINPDFVKVYGKKKLEAFGKLQADGVKMNATMQPRPKLAL